VAVAGVGVVLLVTGDATLEKVGGTRTRKLRQLGQGHRQAALGVHQRRVQLRDVEL
jgi:hypothetical protein